MVRQVDGQIGRWIDRQMDRQLIERKIDRYKDMYYVNRQIIDNYRENFIERQKDR